MSTPTGPRFLLAWAMMILSLPQISWRIWAWNLVRLDFPFFGLKLQRMALLDLEDCNNVCKVFLVVPMGVDGHAEVGRVRKLDLEDLGFFLGRDNVNHRNVRNGRPMRQLPFIALSILQPIRRLKGGTHFGEMPESGT
jgi:hypothetical protein